MIYERVQGKGILAKLLEQGIRVLIEKECSKISNLKIDIISSSNKIIKGEIQKVNINAEYINYKNLLFDEVELEANQIKINIKLKNKKLYFKNNPIIKFKILLSQNSLRSILLSNNWNWIRNTMSKEILEQSKLEDIKIKNDKFLIKAFKKNKNINEVEEINISTEKGKIYLENRIYNKTF